MNTFLKSYLAILTFFLILLGAGGGSALGIQMTIGAIEDAGQSPGQSAYLQFVYPPSGVSPVTTATAPSEWTSSSDAYSYAALHGILDGWHVEAGGNIWSSDLIVGDSLTNLHAGTYRISVVGGAFQYDAFNWSPYEGQWRWQLHIQSSLLPASLILGDTNPLNSAASALGNSFGRYLDIPVNEGGALIFWIYDTNSIDNSGSLTFNVQPIPEPSTFILAGTGLLLLARRFRRSLANLFTQ